MTVSELAGAERAGRTEWLSTIDTLFSEVEAWAREWLVASDWTPVHGWDVLRRKKEMTDDFSHDTYEVPMLEINSRPYDIIQGRDIKLVLEPITFNPSLGVGRVDFYVWPAMYRVRLLHDASHDDWTIKTDSGINWPLPWNRETFIQIAEGLLDA